MTAVEAGRPDPEGPLERLASRLGDIGPRIVACSGGVDSLVLSTVAHRLGPDSTVIAHSVTPAVPAAATARVVASAREHGWRLRLVRSGEFDDERYLKNPTDRCFFCKSHLYESLEHLATTLEDLDGATLLSGANVDDLGEYRPGLRAAAEHDVRHPFVEAGLGKLDIRTIARAEGLDCAELAASPCLASRLYSGTRVTESRLKAVDVGEELIRRITGIDVVRCRLRGDDVLVEVLDTMRAAVTGEVLAKVAEAMRAIEPQLDEVRLDDESYRPGRAVLNVL